MHIKHLFRSLQMTMVGLGLVTATALAQDPIPSSLEDAAPETQSIDAGATPPTVLRPGQDTTPRGEFAIPQDQDPTEEQEVLVNSRFAGWQEVTETPSGERVSDVLRGNWVMIDPNGRFDGQVTAAKDADVSQMNIFLMNKGRLVKQTTVDEAGGFEFTNVRQGAYSLIGWAQNGFFAFGMNVLAYNPQNNGMIVNRVNVTAYQNRTTINTDWIQYYAPQVHFRVYGRYPTGEGRDDPASMYGFIGQYRNLPVSTLATSISSSPVIKTADDRILGRVHQTNSISGRPVDVRSTRVMLFQEDSVVASTTTDNYGGFAFDQVPDGSYGLTAAGVDGVGMIAIEVIGNSAAEGVEATPVDFTMTSSETIGWLNNYAAEVAYRRALLAPRPQKPVEGYGGCPFCDNMGCNNCRKCVDCNSRCASFDKWGKSGCQCDAHKFGDGAILAGWAKQQRSYVERNKQIYDKAFYPEENLRGIANQPNQ